MAITKGKIGNALTSTAADHVVAVAGDVYDESKEKYQSEINSENAESIVAEEARAKAAEETNASSISDLAQKIDGYSVTVLSDSHRHQFERTIPSGSIITSLDGMSTIVFYKTDDESDTGTELHTKNLPITTTEDYSYAACYDEAWVNKTIKVEGSIVQKISEVSVAVSNEETRAKSIEEGLRKDVDSNKDSITSVLSQIDTDEGLVKDRTFTFKATGSVTALNRDLQIGDRITSISQNLAFGLFESASQSASSPTIVVNSLPFVCDKVYKAISANNSSADTTLTWEEKDSLKYSIEKRDESISALGTQVDAIKDSLTDIVSVDYMNDYIKTMYAYAYGGVIRDGGDVWNMYLVKLKGKYTITKSGSPEPTTNLLSKISSESNFKIYGTFSENIITGSTADGTAEYELDGLYCILASVKLGYKYLTIQGEDLIDVVDKFETIEEEKLIDISLPDKIYAVVGDTLQLFYESVFLCNNFKNYDVNVNCEIGSQYPRYYELTPTSSNVGNHTITFTIKDNKGNVLGTKSATIVVATASAPSRNLNVLCIGSSITEGGEWAGELKRRLTASDGTPKGLGLSNITFVGRRVGTKGSVNVNMEATGGYHINSYLATDDIVYKFFFTAEVPAPSGITDGAVYSYYKYDATTPCGTFKIKEFNINDGVGYITCTMLTLDEGITVYGYGKLTKVSGNGPDEMSFASCGMVGNPFAYDGAINISQYATDYCNGSIDVVVFSELMLSNLTNRSMPSPYGTDFSSFFTDLKTLMNYFLAFNSNIKFFVGSIELPDMRGGLGYNFGSKDVKSKYYGYKTSAFAGREALQNYINENSLTDELYIMDWGLELDNENGYPQTNKAVNVRSSVTEVVGSNGLHPSNVGYYQLADAAYRAFVNVLCK